MCCSVLSFLLAAVRFDLNMVNMIGGVRAFGFPPFAWQMGDPFIFTFRVAFLNSAAKAFLGHPYRPGCVAAVVFIVPRNTASLGPCLYLLYFEGQCGLFVVLQGKEVWGCRSRFLNQACNFGYPRSSVLWCHLCLPKHFSVWRLPVLWVLLMHLLVTQS